MGSSCANSEISALSGRHDSRTWRGDDATAVGGRVVAGAVVPDAVRHGLNQHWSGKHHTRLHQVRRVKPVVLRRAGLGGLGGVVHSKDVVAVDAHHVQTVPGRPARCAAVSLPPHRQQSHRGRRLDTGPWLASRSHSRCYGCASVTGNRKIECPHQKKTTGHSRVAAKLKPACASPSLQHMTGIKCMHSRAWPHPRQSNR